MSNIYKTRPTEISTSILFFSEALNTVLPFLPGVQFRGQEKGSFSYLETNATVGPSDDDQLAVQPLLAPVDPHRQLLAEPEGGQAEGCVEEGRGEEGEECRQHIQGHPVRLKLTILELGGMLQHLFYFCQMFMRF